jgi:transposase
VRSERVLTKQLDYNLWYRWFVGLAIDGPVWHPAAFTNRERSLEGDLAVKLLAAVLSHARVWRLLSPEHFTVDGTLVGRRSGATTEVVPWEPADARA